MTDQDVWSKGALTPTEVAPRHGERIIEVLSHRGVVIEEIVSSSRPGSKPYLQDHDEWVVLLEGGADLEVSGEEVALVPGEHLWLPAGTAHHVRSTVQGTRWLAVHIHPEERNGPQG